MIIIENLSFAYDEKPIINGISMMLEEGIHGIIGINGSGKTTLLNLIYGLLKPNSGSILYNGSPKMKKNTSFVGTENYFFSRITGREHLSLFKNPDFDDNLWGNILGIPLDTYISSYSTGMRKKLSILTSLKTNKEVYIFDEPFNGLDLESCQVIVLILKELKNKAKTIIITSHIIDVLKELCNKYYLLSEGEINHVYRSDEFDILKNRIRHIISDKKQELIKQALL